MPKTISTKTGETLTKERHFVEVRILLPVGKPIMVIGKPVIITKDSAGNILCQENDKEVILTDAEVRALPSFVNAYTDLGTACHGKRNDQETPPPAPTGLAAVADIEQILLTWNKAPRADRYVVKRGTATGGPYTVVAEVTGESFLDTGLAASTQYFYVVAAKNFNGEGAVSFEVSATTLAPVAP